jgi:hypothetical protein
MRGGGAPLHLTTTERFRSIGCIIFQHFVISASRKRAKSRADPVLRPTHAVECNLHKYSPVLADP